MELKNFFAQDLQGNVIPSPTVYLYEPGTTTLVTGLKTETGADLTNPFTGTANGKVTVAAPDGDYDMRVTGAGRDTTMRVRFIDASANSAAILREDLASTANGKGAALVGFKQLGAGAVDRTVLDKMREWVSVKDFGAVGDGVADDTAAILNALTSVKTSGAVLMGQRGDTYRVTSELDFSGVLSNGMGAKILALWVMGLLMTRRLFRRR